MNIYFACSITGGRELESFYQQFVAALEADGHIIPTSHLAQAEALEGERLLTPRDVYERDVKWIWECDVLIAEVGVPSHGVGYEIGYALNAGKPVLCLAQAGRRISKMITGNPSLEVRMYSTFEEAITQTRAFLNVL
ncbi:MAG: nucleoside 2-deoxyribosyltransferase [Chloroflexi bacterium]|nr:nucleoside 2-deoxyribosyltransferase [Chloroflexota bacterium]